MSGEEIIEYTTTEARLAAVEHNIGVLTTQLNEWRQQVEGTLMDHEGQKINVFQWAKGVESEFAQLSRSRSPEWEKRMGDWLEQAENLRENIMADNDALVKERVAQNTADLNTRIEKACQDLKLLIRGKMSEMKDDTENKLYQKLMRSAPATAAPTPSAAPPGPFTVPIVPPTSSLFSGPTPASSVLKFTRRLDKLQFQTVTQFLKQLKRFKDATSLNDDTARSLLFQSADGDALRFLESLPDTLTFHEVVQQLVNRVKPADTVALRKLLDCRQKARESIQSFTSRWRVLAESYPAALISTSDLRTIIIDNLNEKWRATARSMIMQDPSKTVDSLFHDLSEIEGPADDRMEIDVVQEMRFLDSVPNEMPATDVNQIVLPGGRLNWAEIRDTRSLLMGWRALMRSDKTLRDECVDWLRRKPVDNQRRNGFRGQQPDRPRQNRIFNVEHQDESPEICEDDIFDQDVAVGSVTVQPRRGPPKQTHSVKILHKSSPVKKAHPAPRTQAAPSQKQVPRQLPVECHNMNFARNPLMFVQAKVNGVRLNSLVDTGAAASIIPLSRVMKLGAAIDTAQTTELLAFDGSSSQSMGTAMLHVELGDTEFVHEFCVVRAESKLIFGNDMWKKQRIVIDPAGNRLRLANEKVVECQAILPKGDHGASQESIRATEPITVDPVLRENTMMIPAGKSFVIAAKSSRTIVLPLQMSKTSPVFDSGRLPPGVITASTMWAKDQRLRLTMTNTTAKSIMIGSKSAIACVIVDPASPPEMQDHTGQVRSLRRV